ncbi:MAG: hypothetical protein M3022_04820 [Actinomycetota bacterium]|nr:hypothetical protein [Actinomycetota bacterium]
MTIAKPTQRATPEAQRFPFRFAPAYRWASLPFGVRPERAWVEIDADSLRARFGPWRLHTALTNVAAVQITGPYAFLKTAGPARLGVTDRGLTFASNGEQGVLISFRRPVAGIEPTGRLGHPELTVTVADVTGLASLVRVRAGV